MKKIMLAMALVLVMAMVVDAEIVRKEDRFSGDTKIGTVPTSLTRTPVLTVDAFFKKEPKRFGIITNLRSKNSSWEYLNTHSVYFMLD